MAHSAPEAGGTGWQSDLIPLLDRGPQGGPPHGARTTDTVLPPRGPTDRASKQRFVVAVSIGVAVVAIPYLWVLCDLWTRSPSLLRTAWTNGYASNFYDLQTRAMLHGHLYVAPGALGPEAFVHGGHQYTYFGIFPSLLRLPVFAVTSSLDGKFSALSLLLAWITTASFASSLLWRIRMTVRGSAPLGRAEAASYGVLVATVMGGSVLMALSANPWLFTEDIAWSVALTVGTLWSLLGVMQRPSWGRVVVSGALILAAVLTRGSTGYACVLGAFGVALWFAVGRRATTCRQWWLPVLLAGLIPLGISSAIDLAKFGIVFGLAESDQLLYKSFGLQGSYFGIRFLPSTLVAYFQPTGRRFRAVFPFITLPSALARPVGGAGLFGRDWVASVPAAMPLLFLLSIWGMVTAFRPSRSASSVVLRIVLAVAAAAGATVLVYGWIANRFVGDLVPVLVAASAVGTVDIWRRLAPTGRRSGLAVLSALTALGIFGVVANLGVAVSFQNNWSTQQVRNLVGAQSAISKVTGHPLKGDVTRGGTLPLNAPAGQLFVAGDCDGLYMATGLLDGSTTSGKQSPLDEATVGLGWVPVELGPSISRTVVIHVRAPLSAQGPPILLATAGGDPVSTLSIVPTGPAAIRFAMSGLLGKTVSNPMRVVPGGTYPVTVVLDTYRHVFSVAWGRGGGFKGLLLGGGPAVMHQQPAGAGATPLSVSVVGAAGPLPRGSLCRNLG
jgi:hypothetical protein